MTTETTYQTLAEIAAALPALRVSAETARARSTYGEVRIAFRDDDGSRAVAKWDYDAQQWRRQGGDWGLLDGTQSPHTPVDIPTGTSKPYIRVVGSLTRASWIGQE